ncbi:transposase [Pseudomonas guariconensis]|uniref:transposase n=1 Tax=Pseudomonas guariconensis TaxID=1288410 RepID=UPI0018D9545D|nr:transposase [Pseudomonas guariconensis]MBH3359676.1 transposase [Pseudomonas guariconensis]
MKLDTFIERLEQRDLEREQDAISADLLALAQNRSLLGECMYEHIQQHAFSRGEQVYSPYGFALHASQYVSLRMTCWLPAQSQAERQTFIYGVPHTHDFELYAVGYQGCGYRTMKYPILNAAQVDARTRPVLGEPEEVRLSPGKLLHMRAFEDLHYQIPPEEFSLSLALMVAVPAASRNGRQEWCFDEELRPIYSGLGSQEQHIHQRIQALWQAHQS